MYSLYDLGQIWSSGDHETVIRYFTFCGIMLTIVLVLYLVIINNNKK